MAIKLKANFYNNIGIYLGRKKGNGKGGRKGYKE